MIQVVSAESACTDEFDQYKGTIKTKIIPYKNEQIMVNTFKGDYLGTIKIQEREIKEIVCDEELETTFTATIKNVQTVKDITSADSALDEYFAKKKAKEIVIKGNAFGKKMKMGFSNFLMRIGSWFS